MGSQKTDIDLLSDKFFEKCKSLPKIRVACVYPTSDDALNGIVESAQMGLIEPILIGPANSLKALAQKLNVDISMYQLIDAEHSEKAVRKAIECVKEAKVDALMKGNLHTDELMKEVIKKESGLRTSRRISHVFVLAIENYHKPFIITDAAINILPDLLTKKDIVQNAVDLVHLLNPDITPKVAILSAVETVNPNIPSTIDAACLSKMADRGQITGAIVDGPFAFDNVISLKAAETKNIKSPVAGDADIFLMPNLEAGNMCVKEMMYVTNTLSAGMILGARVPIILTSRADGVRSRIGSCAIAVIIANNNKLTSV